MLNERAQRSSVDDIRVAPPVACVPKPTDRRHAEDEPTLEMSPAELEEMVRKARRPSEHN